jgi:hypothetical protein
MNEKRHFFINLLTWVATHPSPTPAMIEWQSWATERIPELN